MRVRAWGWDYKCDSDKMSPVTFPSDMSGAHHTHHTDDISSSTAHTKTQTNSEFKTYLLARKAVKIAEINYDSGPHEALSFLMSGCRNKFFLLVSISELTCSFNLINYMETLLFVASDSQIIYFLVIICYKDGFNYFFKLQLIKSLIFFLRKLFW